MAFQRTFLKGFLIFKILAVGIKKVANIKFLFCQPTRAKSTHFSKLKNIKALEYWVINKLWTNITVKYLYVILCFLKVLIFDQIRCNYF